MRRDPTLRPWWQIAYLLPLVPFYLLARAFVEWMDKR
jgi:hypothetical protein